MKTLGKIVNEVDAGIDALKATISWICTDVYGINETVSSRREIVTHTRSFTIEIEFFAGEKRVADDITIRLPEPLTTTQSIKIVPETIQRYLEVVTQLIHKLATISD